MTHCSLPFIQLAVPTRHSPLITYHASMTPERWRQLEAVFHEAVELQEEERAAFLAKVCASDRQLREEAERFIAAHERKSSFIDPPGLPETVELRDDNHEFLRGRRIGPYGVINQLGRGGMGEVFLAQDTRLGRKVALKMLPAAFTQNADRVSRFEREAKAASALDNPNILTIYEIGQSDGVHFIGTEFVDGMTLRQRMNGAKMTSPRRWTLHCKWLRPGSSARSGHRAPRYQAGERDGAARRLGQGPRFWSGQTRRVTYSSLRAGQGFPDSGSQRAAHGIWNLMGRSGTCRQSRLQGSPSTCAAISSRLGWSCTSYSPAGSRRCNGPRAPAKDHPGGSRPSRQRGAIGPARDGGKGTGERPGQAPPVHA